jgi:hypothetical protein
MVVPHQDKAQNNLTWNQSTFPWIKVMVVEERAPYMRGLEYLGKKTTKDT